jgi:CRISPR/Cas system-associated exonuclease Cas4 (RecB family)
MDGRAEATRILFHGLEETLLEDRTRTFIGLDEIEGRQELFASVSERIVRSGASVSQDDIRRHLATIHQELVRKACAFEDIRDFAQKMADIVVYIYEHSSARLHPFFHPYAESFIEELGTLGRSRIKGLAFAERNSYFHFLKRYIGHCFTPFEGTPLKGVQVLGFLETRNLHFKHTYILDANEDVIPDTRKEDTLLPLRLRQMLGLPTYRDRDMLSAYYFNAMIEGSEEIHIFYVENDRKEKSRFVERLLWERQREEKAERTASYVTSVGYRVSLRNDEPPTIAKTREMAEFLKERPCDATSLDVYLRCPVQFYYRYVLGLARKEDAASGIERIDVGRLVHTILFRYFDRRKGARLTAGAIDVEEMDGVVEQVFAQVHGGAAAGSAYLLERQVKRQMAAFLTRYQAPALRKSETTILYLEHRLEAVEAGFRFKGIADRIERRGDSVCIVDYKTGAGAGRLSIDFDALNPAARETWPDAIGSLQLPFYLFLYGASANKDIAQMQAMFLLLGKAHIDDGIEIALWRDADPVHDNFEKARAVILGLAAEIADAEIPFSPAFRTDGACAYCDYHYMCGMQWQGR